MVAGERTYVGIDLDVCWPDTNAVGDIGKLDRDARATRAHCVVTGWITLSMEPGVEVLSHSHSSSRSEPDEPRSTAW